ncbi:uncharacterized protein TNCV_2531561 [Trichonephila clavipes]|nr:uncharacterized protein TNCV_2531561 [Trichonephila clavipes]
MGLSQADAARRLNVSRSVVQRLWDQYQPRRFCVQKPVPGRPQAHKSPAEDRFLSFGTKEKNHYCAAARCRPLSTSGRRISSTTVRNRFPNAGLYARRPVAFPSNGRQRRNRLCWARENMFLGRSNNGLLCCSQTSPDLQWRVIQGVY